MRKVIFLGLTSLFLAGAGEGEGTPEPAAPPGPTPEAMQAAVAKTRSLEFQLAVWKAITGTAPQIDRCTQRYTEEFPDRVGTVTINVEIPGDGRVRTAKADSPLQASQNLTGCLKDVARSWRFPAIEPAKVSTSLVVQVAKGQKFAMRKPGEKEPEAKQPEAPKDEGFMRFTPSKWDAAESE